MSKTQRKREEDPALSKNHGNSIKYRKRLVEDMEAEQERREAALERMTEISQELGLYDEFKHQPS